MAHDSPVTTHLHNLLAKRDPPKTICPSEAARALTGEDLKHLGFTHWRDAMPHVREVVWDLRERGVCEVLQQGHVIDDDVALDQVHGPIRVRRK